MKKINGKKLLLLFCESIRDEVVSLPELICGDDVCFDFYPERCGRPPLAPEEVSKIAGRHEAVTDVHITGGVCLASLRSNSDNSPSLTVNRLENCIGLLAGSFAVSELIRRRAYIVTSGWLKSWKERIDEWGFTNAQCRDFLSESFRLIALVDTGVNQNASEQLLEMGGYCGLQAESHPVGTALLSSSVRGVIDEWRIKHLNAGFIYKERKLSEYAMAFDILSKIASSVDYREVAAQILHLYAMIFAANSLSFIRFSDNSPIEASHCGFGSVEPDEKLFMEAMELEGSYAVINSEDGFMIRVSYDSRTLGVIKATDFAFPQYSESYLNLALSTVEVCGLALRNADSFSALEKSKEEIENAHLELKATHQRLVEQEKHATVGQLAAGIAHEINTPIGFVKSNLSTLEKYYIKIVTYLDHLESLSRESEWIQEKKRLKIGALLVDITDLINESKHGINRVATIVNDLLLYSQNGVEQDKEVDINLVIDSAINIVSSSFCEGINIVDERSDLPKVIGSPRQYIDMFVALFTNARDALSGKCGTIIVKSSFDGSNVLISVSDNGCGMDEELIQKIFDPFFTTKEPGMGTGLGLSKCREIAARCGGNIEVLSRVGQGSVFTVVLPSVVGSKEFPTY